VETSSFTFRLERVRAFRQRAEQHGREIARRAQIDLDEVALVVHRRGRVAA
jgi:hypothetical protein